VNELVCVYFLPEKEKSRLEILVEIRDKIIEAKAAYPDKFLDREALIGEIMRVYDVKYDEASKFCDDAGVYKE